MLTTLIDQCHQFAIEATCPCHDVHAGYDTAAIGDEGEGQLRFLRDRAVHEYAGAE